MKRVRLFILAFLLLLAAVWLGSSAYLHWRVRDKFHERELLWLVSEINNAPVLPLDFKKTYEALYPGVFENSLTNTALKAMGGSDVHASAGYQVARTFSHLLQSRGGDFSRLDYIALTLFIEERCSQEKCFEFVLARWDFLHGLRGPEIASQYFFGKQLENLSCEEQLGIILRMRNPVYWDRACNSPRYFAAISELRKKLQPE